MTYLLQPQTEAVGGPGAGSQPAARKRSDPGRPAASPSSPRRMGLSGPAVCRAITDPRVTPLALRGLLILALEPDPYTNPFPIKALWVAHRLGVGAHRAARALQLLEETGYLLVESHRPRIARVRYD